MLSGFPKSTLPKRKTEEEVSVSWAPEKRIKWNQAEFTSTVTDRPFNRLDNAAFSKRRFGNRMEDDEDGENYVGDSQVMTSFRMQRNEAKSKSSGCIKNEQKLGSYRRILSDDEQEQDPKVTPFSKPTPMKRTLIAEKQRFQQWLNLYYTGRSILSDDEQEQDPKVTRKQQPKSCRRVHCWEDEDDDMAMISFYEFNKKPIGLGAFGTSVYGGMNKKDGRRVAIKKIQCHTEKQTRQYKREIKHLLMLRGCSNVVNYLDVIVKQDIVYIILELMEGTLESLLSQPNLDIKFTELSRDIINALRFLHTAKIIHRDIKPRNILYVTSPRIMLKLADFGLSKMIESDSSTAGYTGGTRCWMAPEVLKSLDQFSTASDIFASGLVLHYLMAFKHPFAPANVTVNKENRLFVEYQIVHNILSNSPIFDGSISPEALHLINQMLDENKDQRPSADEILSHPFFWKNLKKVKFLEAVANQPEICQSHSKPKWASDFGKDLESSVGVEFLTKPWSEFSTSMRFVYDEMTLPKKRKYNTSSAVDLLRFIRNAHQHVSDSSRTYSFQKFVLKDHVFFDNFKTLFMEVYKTVRKHEWDSTRQEIKYVS